MTFFSSIDTQCLRQQNDTDDYIKLLFDDICSDVNLNNDYKTKIWEAYTKCNLNYLLEGDKKEWLICAIFMECLFISIVSKSVNYNDLEDEFYIRISLVKLLRAIDSNFTSFFDKAHKWYSMNSVSYATASLTFPSKPISLNDLLEQQLTGMERQFDIVKCLYYTKYLPCFNHIFLNNNEIDEIPNQDHSFILHLDRQQKELVSEQHELYEFIWMFYIYIKGCVTSTMCDGNLVNCFTLLVCVMELILSDFIENHTNNDNNINNNNCSYVNEGIEQFGTLKTFKRTNMLSIDIIEQRHDLVSYICCLLKCTDLILDIKTYRVHEFQSAIKTLFYPVTTNSSKNDGINNNTNDKTTAPEIFKAALKVDVILVDTKETRPCSFYLKGLTKPENFDYNWKRINKLYEEMLLAPHKPHFNVDNKTTSFIPCFIDERIFLGEKFLTLQLNTPTKKKMHYVNKTAVDEIYLRDHENSAKKRLTKIYDINLNQSNFVEPDNTLAHQTNIDSVFLTPLSSNSPNIENNSLSTYAKRRVLINKCTVTPKDSTCAENLENTHKTFVVNKNDDRDKSLSDNEERIGEFLKPTNTNINLASLLNYSPFVYKSPLFEKANGLSYMDSSTTYNIRQLKKLQVISTPYRHFYKWLFTNYYTRDNSIIESKDLPDLNRYELKMDDTQSHLLEGNNFEVDGYAQTILKIFKSCKATTLNKVIVRLVKCYTKYKSYHTNEHNGNFNGVENILSGTSAFPLCKPLFTTDDFMNERDIRDLNEEIFELALALYFALIERIFICEKRAKFLIAPLNFHGLHDLDALKKPSHSNNFLASNLNSDGFKKMSQTTPTKENTDVNENSDPSTIGFNFDLLLLNDDFNCSVLALALELVTFAYSMKFNHNSNNHISGGNNNINLSNSKNGQPDKIKIVSPCSLINSASNNTSSLRLSPRKLASLAAHKNRDTNLTAHTILSCNSFTSKPNALGESDLLGVHSSFNLLAKLRMWNLFPYTFYRVIELCVRAAYKDALFTREMVQHLSRIEERCLESEVWSATSNLWDFLKVTDHEPSIKHANAKCRKEKEDSNGSETNHISASKTLPDVIELKNDNFSVTEQLCPGPKGRTLCKIPTCVEVFNSNSVEYISSSLSSTSTPINFPTKPSISNMKISVANNNGHLDAKRPQTLTQVPISSGLPAAKSNLCAEITEDTSNNIINYGSKSYNKLDKNDVAIESRELILAKEELHAKCIPSDHLSPSNQCNCQLILTPVYLQKQPLLPICNINDNKIAISKHPIKSGSLALFFRKVYHLAALRIRDLFSKIGIPNLNNQHTNNINVNGKDDGLFGENFLLHAIWTCFEYSLTQKTEELFMDRHIDQIIMCCIYVMAKITTHDISFADIMKHYRTQANSTNQTYRHVLISSGPTKGGVMNDDKITANRYGDIIKFYNKVFVEEIKGFATQFTTNYEDLVKGSASTVMNAGCVNHNNCYKKENISLLISPIPIALLTPLSNNKINSTNKNITDKFHDVLGNDGFNNINICGSEPATFCSERKRIAPNVFVSPLKRPLHNNKELSKNKQLLFPTTKYASENWDKLNLIDPIFPDKYVNCNYNSSCTDLSTIDDTPKVSNNEEISLPQIFSYTLNQSPSKDLDKLNKIIKANHEKFLLKGLFASAKRKLLVENVGRANTSINIDKTDNIIKKFKLDVLLLNSPNNNILNNSVSHNTISNDYSNNNNIINIGDVDNSNQNNNATILLTARKSLQF